ncbi:carboxylic ester hydrolase [Branchiostoma belcheri]|nr:carboxylic ester hydrolase [Branchiostoma belcheri]
MAEDSQLAGCPNTCILVCEFDVLRDDGIMYARRLEKVGVGARLVHYKNGFHGILNLITKPLEFQGTRSVACQDSNPGPLDSESRTLPLRHTTPPQSEFVHIPAIIL